VKHMLPELHGILNSGLIFHKDVLSKTSHALVFVPIASLEWSTHVTICKQNIEAVSGMPL
jgi:hypothetical protein